MPTLMDLTGQFLDLHRAMCAVADMDLSEEDRAQCDGLLLAQLDATGDGLAQKVDGYGDVLRVLAAEEEAYTADLKLMTAKRDARRNGAKRLKDRLTQAMDLLGAESLAGQRYKLALQNNPPAVREVDEQAALEHGWAEPVTTLKVDNRAIIAAWKADPDSIKGVAEVGQGRSLRVR